MGTDRITISTRSREFIGSLICLIPIGGSTLLAHRHLRKVPRDRFGGITSPTTVLQWPTSSHPCDSTITRAIASNRRWLLLLLHRRPRSRSKPTEGCTNYLRHNHCTAIPPGSIRTSTFNRKHRIGSTTSVPSNIITRTRLE